MSKTIPLSEIESAFDFVSMGPPCSHTAILCRDTGEFFYMSDLGDSDELPEDVDDPARYIEIPHKNDLDLGRALVMDFTARHLPDEHDTVRRIFDHRGAYGRFKDLLARREVLGTWHEFETEQSDSALKEWCADNGIVIADQP